MTATAVAAVTGYSAYWIGQIARRYNADGPNGVRDRRHTTCTGRPELPASHLAELGAVVASPHPLGDRWCGRTVAQWLTDAAPEPRQSSTGLALPAPARRPLAKTTASPRAS